MHVEGPRAGLIYLLLFPLLLAGCERRDEQIKVYRLTKPSGESTPVGKDAIASTNAPVKSTIERVPSATSNVATPPNWEPQPLSQMRQASFLVHGENGALVDISFVSLGPAAGNVLDNVNRWLDQLAQPPIRIDKLASTIQKLHTARGDVDIVDLAGKPENGDPSKDGRIIAAIASDEGKTSFFKMRGNADLVGTEKANFVKWVSAMLSGANQTTVASSAPNADKAQIKWEIPSGWSSAPASAMRYASFAAGDKIDISVVTFPGDGGSDADNINRWSQQIGAAITEKNPDIIPLKGADASFSTVDLAGAKARTLAAWTRRDGRTWFFKLTGPNAAVEKEKSNFAKFVQSVRF
jgi:hypothetical protein